MKQFLLLYALMFMSPLLASGIDAGATSAPCDNATPVVRVRVLFGFMRMIIVAHHYTIHYRNKTYTGRETEFCFQQ